MKEMRLNLKTLEIDVKPFDTPNELKEKLRQLGESSLLVFSEYGYGDSVLLTINGLPDGKTLYCGFCVYSGIVSEILQDTDSCCWFGYDSKVAYVDLQKRKVLFEKDYFAFWRFEPLVPGKVLVGYELGVACLDSDGNELWNFTGPGILWDFKLEKNTLICTFEGEKILRKSILNMSKIKNTTKYSKNVLINNILLLLGLLLHSALYFSVLGKDVRFSAVTWNLWAWMSIPFLMLFLTNYQYHQTKSACNTVLVAILVLIFNSLATNIAFIAFDSALGAVCFLIFPVFAIFINAIFGIKAMANNRHNRKNQTIRKQ